MSLEDSVTPSDKENEVQAMATQLLQVYCDHTNEEGNTNLTGLLMMEGMMNAVLNEYRASVFSSFLDLLKLNEIEYDYKVFQSNPSEAIH